MVTQHRTPTPTQRMATAFAAVAQAADLGAKAPADPRVREVFLTVLDKLVWEINAQAQVATVRPARPNLTVVR